jgi:hypothetical protein
MSEIEPAEVPYNDDQGSTGGGPTRDAQHLHAPTRSPPSCPVPAAPARSQDLHHLMGLEVSEPVQCQRPTEDLPHVPYVGQRPRLIVDHELISTGRVAVTRYVRPALPLRTGVVIACPGWDG